jgi:carbon-monoxide dehydrogenase medium subunit
MIPAEFDYRRAASAEEAVGLLAGNDNAKLLAGGHSLLPMMKLRLAAPSLLVDIGGIEELRGIHAESDGLSIGSMTTHAEIAAAQEITGTYGALVEAAAAIGDVQVRNCGTIGGSLAHADPAADYAAAALVLDASVEVLGPHGPRSIVVDDLFAGLFTTSLADAEIVTAVRFPTHQGVSVYEKFVQPASGFAIVGVAAQIVRDDNGACTLAHLAATGISDRPLRLSQAETALQGTSLEAESVAAAAAVADAGIDTVLSDTFAADDYRRHLLGVLVARAVQRAAS